MLKLLERMPELKMRVDPSKGDRRARIRAAAYAILTVTAAFALLQVCHLFGLLALVQLRHIHFAVAGTDLAGGH